MLDEPHVHCGGLRQLVILASRNRFDRNRRRVRSRRRVTCAEFVRTQLSQIEIEAECRHNAGHLVCLHFARHAQSVILDGYRIEWNIGADDTLGVVCLVVSNVPFALYFPNEICVCGKTWIGELPPARVADRQGLLNVAVLIER